MNETIVCERCDDTGVVRVRGHHADCIPIRCAEGCPVVRTTRCPVCEKRELGEDLS